MTDQPISPEALAPHSLEAEESTLGSILINPDSLFEIPFLQPSDFYVLRNAYTFAAIQAIQARGDGIDNLTVIQELRDRNRLDAVGGSAFVTGLLNNTPTHIHAETYARMVERAAIRRRLLKAASEIAQDAVQTNLATEEVLDAAEARIYEVAAKGRRNEKPSFHQLISLSMDQVERMYNKEAETLGVPSGFYDLDSMISGLEKSRLYIIAARPGMGKTSLMCNIAANAAKTYKQRVGFFSLEMNSEQLIIRLTAAESGINSERLRLGNMDDREWSRYTETCGRMTEWRFAIDDTGGIDVNRIRARMRLWQREQGLDLVVVDYLQLAHSAGKHGTREAEVSEVARSLKELAREFDIPILAASQLSRAVESRQDKRPMLSDLRESGEIEQAADVVMFIYRDEVYNPNTDKPNQAEIIIGKNRDGRTGPVSLYFIKETTLFTNQKREAVDFRGYNS